MEDTTALVQKMKWFCDINEQFRIAFEITEKNHLLSESNKCESLLQYIANDLLVNPYYFDEISNYFSQELPKLLFIAIFSHDTQYYCEKTHISNSILLNNTVKNRSDLKSYAIKYFDVYPSPFDSVTQSRSKKSKLEDFGITDLHVVESCYFLLKSNPSFYRSKWNWSLFIKKYLNHNNSRVTWLCCHTLAILLGMNEQQLEAFICSKLCISDHRLFTCHFSIYSTLIDIKYKPSINPVTISTATKKCAEKVTNVSGIYIPMIGTMVKESALVEVPSTYNNLRKIVLGLTSNKAICIQGPVGSGKTSLVEYISYKTGRKLGENFVKVQLGDQTDSKMLLGTYRCTDIPGEFIWQPGVLTQAILEGHWLLLEDIDTASMDIASVLAGLLETHSLTVPGYRDAVPVSPGFQLFLTQRFFLTISGIHKKHSNAMALLEKHLFQINVQSLSVHELKTILNTRYVKFQTIADRMISIFQLFTQESSENKMVSFSRSSRIISSRDFFKWCSRAIIDFDVQSQNSALKVLQDAIDVFCCSYSSYEDRLNLTKQISTYLGITSQKAEYFFKSYKPDMKLTQESLIVGRAVLKRENNQYCKQVKFSFTRPSSVLLERIICCVSLKEPVLLVGETGTGKTSSVQYLAGTIGQKLVVINMNQQSDSADLLGGFKPVDLKFIVAPIRREFEEVFCDYFKVEPNKKYLSNIALCFNNQRWSDLVKLMKKSCEAALNRLKTNLEEYSQDEGSKECPDIEKLNKIVKHKEFLHRWQLIAEKLYKLDTQLKQKSALAFAFIEGSLVKAVENGYWVLLDEINLANAETLECLSGLLEGSHESLCLLERGDKKPVRRHPNFTLFACMNPSTDVGKKDLPAGLRNRFTEFFIDELNEKSDLLLLVNNYLEALSVKEKDLNKIVNFYLNVKIEANSTLSDGIGQKPHFSLRSLCRALTIASKNPCGMFKRSLYEAFSLSFLTQLDSSSYQIVENMISKYLIGDEKAINAIMKQPIPEPKESSEQYLQFEGYWIKKGTLDVYPPDEYVLTQSVRRNLKDLVRIVSIGKLPVLLQGDTSVGKTSLITYLAKSSGNKCVRINNHEHTDLQEYIGSYMANVNGKLVFREGLLVEAMRKGHWIILDELNLAPTDVLEALNRVLDDNRELFIPETQETVKAHQNFMLFATQNPPGAYGGRKMLSRAFRNRFVELHFNEIPPEELEFILHKRCQMAPSYAKKMVNVMRYLQMRRKGSAAFAGKHGFITLRDLFRWGERYRLAQITEKLYDWDQHLADEGYLVLAGRVRKDEEKVEIIDALQKHLKRDVKTESLFTLSNTTSSVTKHILQKIEENRSEHSNIVWTYSMRQLTVLTLKAIEFKEPVLLVGETGGGKTTVCQLIAENSGQKLITVNCHMHSESSDFIGGLRPIRDHTSEESTKLFEWVDGPLLRAMVNGDIFLADEISLADDSVLERLNSLLEPERSLLLAEKGTDLNNRENSELVVANPNFIFIGTMNPGGDYGKKELSPALRNRFTEIWCEPCTRRADLVAIIEQNIKIGVSFGNQQDGTSGIGNSIMDFIDWFRKSEIGKRCTVSIRDILTWVYFINNCVDKMDITEAYMHGAYLTFLDSFGSGITSTESLKALDVFRSECLHFLISQVKPFNQVPSSFLAKKYIVEKVGCKFGIHPFYIEMSVDCTEDVAFSFNAPTTVFNTLCILRGMQLNKAILLEGSPGVGKTSLVTALAKYTGHKLFRVNLSDQTDISDLFGADLPVEGGSSGQFSWRDGPLLQALKDGSWILLDELNLASQSVLEGLNACLDHRGEIFIPELGKMFHVRQGTRFFGCQNPVKQGGSRRGLPQSFLNRFIQVYVHSLMDEDLLYILSNQFKHIPSEIISKIVKFNSRIVEELENHTFGHKGAPWECNLRDLTRWCEVMVYQYEVNPNLDKIYQPENVVNLIYADRMRILSDKLNIENIFEEVFECKVCGTGPVVYTNKQNVFIGDVCIKKKLSGVNTNVLKQDKKCLVLRSQLSILRSLAYCVNLNWMSILVGCSGSGKSSVVKTLASLAGKTLKTLPVTSAMDTTDILGGFEQTDYSRHLDEISKETELLLLKTLQELLINSKTDESIDLLIQWESYLAVDGTKKQSAAEDTRLFILKITKLNEIWENLKLFLNTDEHKSIIKLQENSKALTECVKKEGSLNAGGKFEWVDSLLIKCLQEGSWLLIENVNLCSSAVLDRLNALLEPHGVLTVSERGVDQYGQMIEIKPHKDFRLFLTMDPKNGEISRAMRNRGVEIYILNEQERGGSNDLDMKSLTNLEGLTKTRQINALVKIHIFLSEIVSIEKPHINEILQASSLISQQIINGMDIVQAFSDTISEIYSNRSSDFINILNNKIESLLNDPSDMKDSLEIVYNENVSLKTQNLEICSDIEKVKQQAVLIQNYISKHNTCASNFVYNLLINYYSLTSVEDFEIRHLYLQNVLNSSNSALMLALAEELYGTVLKHSNFEIKNLPLDGRWTPEIPNVEKNLLQSNNFILALYICSSYFKNFKANNSKSLQDISNTLFDYMQARKKKRIENKFNDIIINEYLDLVEEFDKYLLEIPMQLTIINDEEVVELLYLIFWRYAFHRCTLVSVRRIDLRELHCIVINLCLHYKWFVKNAVQKIKTITRTDISENLKSVISRIDKKLEIQYSFTQNISKCYQKCNNKPLPFISKVQLEGVKLYNDLCHKYDICARGNDVIRIVNILHEDKEIRPFLVELGSELKYEVTDISTKITMLKSLEEKSIKYDINQGDVSSYNKFELQLFPILDYFTQLIVRSTMKNCPDIIESEVTKSSVLIPPELSSVLICFIKTKDFRLFHEIATSYYLYLINSASVKPIKYLNYPIKKSDELILNGFQPRLTFYVCYLLLNSKDLSTCRSANLGNFRDLMKQHTHLNLLLWRNLYQLSEENYDYTFCEKEFIRKVYEIFIKQLANSLNVEEANGTLQETTIKCVNTIKEIEKVTQLPDPNNEMVKIMKRLQKCSTNINKLTSVCNSNNAILIISDLYMEVSYIKAVLNSKLPLVDTLIKKEIKKMYYIECFDYFTDMKRSYELINQIFSNTNSTIHGYYMHVKQFIEKLKLKIEKLDKHVAYRPTEVLYEDVLKVVNHAFSTILSEKHVDKVTSKLTYHILNLIDAISKRESIDHRHFSSVLRHHESTVVSYENLIFEWNVLRNSYPDIIEPLLSNIVEFLYGLKMKLSLFRKLLMEYENMKLGINVKDELINLVKLPSLDDNQNNYSKLVEVCNSKRFINFIDQIFQYEDLPNINKQEKFRLLKCGLHESFNHCIIEAKETDTLNKNVFMEFNTILELFVSAWNNQEEEKEIKQKEAESLYKMKSKCDKPEEEKTEEELKELFPNFHIIDFADLQKNVDVDEPEEHQTEHDYKGVISYNDLQFVVHLHTILVQNFTRTEWLNPSKNKTINSDFISPLIEKYNIFKQILDKSIHCLDYTMDTKLIASLNVLLAVKQKYDDVNVISDPSSPTRHIKNRNFYKNSNVDEVKSCYHIIEELRIKINELLDEWPDQPTLKFIILVIERIYKFDLTSPVSRFLTGFEILLSKCHEWEEVAHSGVSLSQHFQSITQQIISWRKFELSMWKDLLNHTYDRLNEPLAKWWLYMFNIMEQFIHEKKITNQELIELLQAFVTKSNLAEFAGRLELLYVFHCHATFLDRTKETELFISILWNIYGYFKQYSLIIANKIKDLRSPVEKKLKDYIKIVKWKDISYWSVRETVDKTHKTLHKYMKEFQDILQQPVTSYLVNIGTTDIKENVGIWDRPQRQSPKTYHYTLDAEAYMAKQSLIKKCHSTLSSEEEGILSKTVSYFLKSRKLCKDTILATNYPSLVQSLDVFVTEIIDTSTHLQNLEVDTNLSKEKQKSQAKNILQQKHRSLADLFKNLSKLGLSFRTGIVESKVRNPSDDFTFKPVDLNANFSHINYGRKEEKILTIWDSCEIYYVRSLMRIDVMETALRTPAPDLGLQNIERCKGFSSHLMSLAQKQKLELIDCTRLYYYLRFYVKRLTEFCEGKEFLHFKTIRNISELLKNITIVMNQYKIILNSCPVEDSLNSEISEVPVLETKLKEIIAYKNDEVWLKASNLIKEILSLVNKINLLLHKCQGYIPSIEFDLLYPQFVPVSKNQLETDLFDIYKNIDNLKNLFANTAINDSLLWIIKEIGKIGEQFEEEYCREDIFNVDQFKKKTEKLYEKILIIMQNIYKKYTSINLNSDKKSKENPEEVEEEQLQEDHLKKLVENLFTDMSILEMKNVLKVTHKISSILLMVPPKQGEEYKVFIFPCLPLLEQLVQLYQYFITQQVSAYRVTCKMNSVLLNIFINLVSKGFCTPQEFSGELDNDGSGQPTDGLGLGEGQGEKDVSDKIETEDQLDDAQPADQEKETEDKECEEEEKGIEMSEDFDSKLQDTKQKEGDDDEESSNDSDASEQMGETEKDANQLDEEIWGSDKEDDVEDKEESNHEEEKGDKGEKIGEDQIGANEKDRSKGDKDENDKNTPEEKENKKEINEMNEPELDDDQIDPHHGKQPELPEPEPMDLPDDLQLDEGHEKDDKENENQDENPFDIDTMKEQNISDEKKEQERKEDDSTNEEKKISSDEDEITREADNDIDDGEEDHNDKNNKDNTEDNKDFQEPSDNEKEEGTKEENEETVPENSLDPSQSNQENVEAMNVDNVEGADRTEANKLESQKSSQSIEELCQEDTPDKEGVGQSQMEETKSGHSANTTTPQDIKGSKRQLEDQMKQQKPGESDSQRSLGDVNEPLKKKLKTSGTTIEEMPQPEKEESNIDDSAEMYQHIKEAKETTTQILDVATKEQAESQKIENKDDKSPENSIDLHSDEEPEEVEMTQVPTEKSEELDRVKEKKSTKTQHPEGEILQDIQDINVEGDLIETITVSRPTESTHHTQLSNLTETTATRLSFEDINNLRSEVAKQLSTWNDPPSTVEAEETWQKISSVTSSLARDLSEQLRLVLEPTQASRLKGDFRTGRRINMRKVIPYIASQFRKDKIWMRRTKPSKRDYQIILAIDDSSSMADNHSKELAFESISLISKALTLLESGELAVLSFGETTEVIHKLTDQFTDKSGVKFLQKFKFDQNKTCIAKLVDFATEMFNQRQTRSIAINAKLLVIISDGRGVFSEGETYVRQAVRRAKLSNIFMIFIIIDNPENKHSILDIRMPVFKDGKILNIQTYMDVFPFSFYVILRDINSLPNVLSDALRQWFEIVSNLDTQ